MLQQYPVQLKLQTQPVINKQHKNRTGAQKNFTGFFSSINQYAVVANLTDADYPYVWGVLQDLSNTDIADRLGVSRQTVKRKLDKLCEKLGVSTKKKLKDHLRNFM